MSETIARALTDMRKGRRVLVVTLTKDGARDLLNEVRPLLEIGEKAHRATGVLAVYRQDSGQIRFASIVTMRDGGARGGSFDTVIVDHSELRAELAPTQFSSADPAFVCLG